MISRSDKRHWLASHLADALTIVLLLGLLILALWGSLS